MPSPLVATTIQSCILNATSNIVAQFIVAYKSNATYLIKWTPVFQFALYNALNSPPNFLWQSYLESVFPSHYLIPSPSATFAGREKVPEHVNPSHDTPASKLSIPNTMIKFFLDQTIGAALNTLMFSLVIAGFRGSSYAEAIETAKRDFWPLVTAGWKLWPAVSLLNFTLVKSVEGRSLVGSLAGMVWGIYLSLMTT